MRLFVILLALIGGLWLILDRFPTVQEAYPDSVILRWATDANPARWDQIRVFNELHREDRIRVMLQPAAGVSADVQLSGRRGPDLIDIYDPVRFRQYASQNVLVDITQMAAADGITSNSFWEAAIPQAMYQGRLMAVPCNASAWMIYYNKNVFDRCNVPYPEGPWSWEDFVQTAARLTRRDTATGLYQTFGYHSWPGAADIFNWAVMDGGHFWGMDPEAGIEIHSQLDSPPLVASMDMIHRMVVRDAVAPGPGQYAEGVTGEALNSGLMLFMNDKVGMLCIGRWVLSEGWKHSNLRYGVTVLPTPPGVERVDYTYGGRVTAITRDCRHPEAAWKFLQFLAEAPYNRILVGQGDGVSAVKALIEEPWHLFQPEFPEVQLRMYERLWARFDRAMSARIAGQDGAGWARGLDAAARRARCMEAWDGSEKDERERLQREGACPLNQVPDTVLAALAAEEWGRTSPEDREAIRAEVTAEMRLNLAAMPRARQPVPSPYCFGPEWDRILSRAYEQITRPGGLTPAAAAGEAARAAGELARRNADPAYGREKYRIGNRVGAAVLALTGAILLACFRRLREGLRRAEARERPAISGRRETWAERASGFAFVAPNLCGFLVFTAFPMVFSLTIAFSHWNTFAETVRFAGFDNFVDIIWNPRFWYYTANTVILMLGMPLSILGSLVLAVVLNRKLRGNVVFRTVFYLPSLVSGVAIFVLWRWIFDAKFGLLNVCIRSLVPSAEPPAWLTSQGLGWPWLPVYPALVTMGLWAGVGGSTMLLYLAGLSNIPPDLYEAAEIDGAGPWSKFWRVTWPLLMPTTFFVLVMGVIGGLQGGTEMAMVMTGGGPNEATTTIGYYVFREAFFQFRVGVAAAAAWVLFVIIFLLTLLSFRLGSQRHFT